MQIVDGYFRDDRWVNGTWDFAQFANAKGETDWDAVIDAEMGRRRLLEDTPIPSRNDDPVFFDTNMIPWWAWVRRFHLPEAEKLNGRAAMVGYLAAGLVDLTSGAGLVDQQVRRGVGRHCSSPRGRVCAHGAVSLRAMGTRWARAATLLI